MKDPRKALTDALMRRRPNPLAGRLAASPLAAALAQGASQGAGPQGGTLPNALTGAIGGGALPPGMLGRLFGGGQLGGLFGGGFSPDSVAQRMPGFIDQAKQMLQSGNTGIGGLLSLFMPGAHFAEGKAQRGDAVGPTLGAHPRSGFEMVTLGSPTGEQMGQRGMSGVMASAPRQPMRATTKRRGPAVKI